VGTNSPKETLQEPTGLETGALTGPVRFPGQIEVLGVTTKCFKSWAYQLDGELEVVTVDGAVSLVESLGFRV